MNVNFFSSDYVIRITRKLDLNGGDLDLNYRQTLFA